MRSGARQEEMGGLVEIQHRRLTDLTRPKTRDMVVNFHPHDGQLTLSHANTAERSTFKQMCPK